MVRKRSWYTRARDNGARPKTPAPKTGWLLVELSRLTGVSLRTLRYYVSRGVLRPLEYRGTATRYPRRELLRLLRVLGFKLETAARRFRLADAKKMLETLGEPDLEAWLSTVRLTPELAAALNMEPGRALASQPADRPASGARAAEPLRGVQFEAWQRVRLLPGLELCVSDNASAVVRAIAQKIYDEYVGSSTIRQVS